MERMRKNKYNFVVSYATRPMRSYETQGFQHIFISEETADKILVDSDKIIAYTKIGDNGYRYFVTEDCLVGKNIYIIDPNGIKTIKENHKEYKNRLKVIYIYAPDDIRDQRAKDSRSDYNTEYKKRCINEENQFTEFEMNKDYDILIRNIDFDDALATVCKYLEDNYKEDTLFLVAGRTCAGKDRLMNEAIKKLNSLYN